MAKGVKWTDEENKILVQAITANPHNLSEAIRKASKKLNRTTKACKQHWYSALSPKNNPTKVGISFVSVGSNSVYKNRKNSGTSILKPEKSTLWSRIKKFLGL